MNLLTPTNEQAWNLALMMSSGMPSRDAIRYFLEDPSDELLCGQIHDNWLKSKALSQAILKLQGKAWQDMSLEEKIKHSIDKTYAEMAYYLYSNNYSELTGQEKAKADTCRVALEQKLAGNAGKLNELDAFWSDLLKGKITKASIPALPA